MGDTNTELKGEVILTAEVIAQFSETEKAIVKIEEDLGSLVITDPDDKEQYDKVHDGRMELVKIRTQGIDPLEKQLKAPAIAFNNAVGEMAEGLRSRVKRVEAHLKSQEDIVDKKREEERKEKERKNAEKLQERVNRMKTVDGPVDLLWLKGLTDDLFEDEFNKFQIIFDTKKEEEEKEKQRLEKEKQEQEDAQKKIDEDRDKLEKEKEEIRNSRKAIRHTRMLSLGFTYADDALDVGIYSIVLNNVETKITVFGVTDPSDEQFNANCEHYQSMIDTAKKQKEAQDIIDNEKTRKEKEARIQARMVILNGMGFTCNGKVWNEDPKTGNYCFDHESIMNNSDDDFNKEIAGYQKIRNEQAVAESSKSDRERLLDYVQALKAVPIPENLLDTYSKFPAQIARTFEHMETLIKTA